MKNLILILIVVFVAAGCTQAQKEITGYWTFSYGSEIEANGVAHIDSMNLMWYHDGIGFVPSSYFIKVDSLYCYNIIDKDTVTNYTCFIQFLDESNLVMKNKDGVGIYKRITEKEFDEYIDERENRIIEQEIIPIKVEEK